MSFSAPHSASLGSPGSIGELRIQAATAAALLRMAIDVRGPAAGVDAARADAAAAEATLDAALAASGAPPVRLLPQSIRPIYKAPPPEALAPPRAAGTPLPAAGAAASSSGLAVVSAPPDADVADAPDAPVGASASPGDAAAIPARMQMPSLHAATRALQLHSVQPATISDVVGGQQAAGLASGVARAAKKAAAVLARWVRFRGGRRFRGR